MSGDIKIISLNCSIKNNDKFEALASFIDSQNPDMVVLQEVNLTDEDFSKKVNSLLKVPFQFSKTEVVETYTTSNGDTYTQGQSILSRFKIESSKKNLTNVGLDRHNRIAQFVDFYKNGEKIKLANVHFAAKENNLVQLEEVVSEKPDIIVGDFNIRGQDLKDFLFGRDDFSAACEFFDYVSFPGSDMFFQIDHCLISRKFTFREFDIFDGLSDHNALIFEIGENE